MSDPLYKYYEHELTFVRQDALDFAKKYPAVARSLGLEKGQSVDPHVERLIEAFALLAGRVQRRLDDQFPELTDALLSILYPHYLAPIPSLAIAQFDVDPTNLQAGKGFLIPRHSQLHTAPIAYFEKDRGKELPCQFRTCYPVTLWPVAVTAARFMAPPFPSGLQAPPRAAAVLRIELECKSDLGFAGLDLERFRLYLHSGNQVVANLYELLFNNVLKVAFRSPDRGTRVEPVVVAPDECLFPVGFERDDGLLPYARQSFLGYRLLTELFAFPQKFHFVDLGGWEQVRRAGFKNKVEVVLFLSQTERTLEAGIDNQTFQPFCTPVVNLFEKKVETFTLDQARYQYLVKPDVGHPLGFEVYSVDRVEDVEPGRTKEYLPFYSFQHGRGRDSHQSFWYATRRPSEKEDDAGTDVYMTLVDLEFNPKLPARSVVMIETTCSNRDVLAKLAGEQLDLELEMAAPLRSAKGVRCLQSPTRPLRPDLHKAGYWRLISQLSLNHLSLTPQVDHWEELAGKDQRADAEREELTRQGREALQEILSLNDFSERGSGQRKINDQLVNGILAIRSRRVVSRTGGPTASGFARGLEITLELDRENYEGTGVFLFAAVLERFLALYASINSFTQLVVATKQEGLLRKWRPRAADEPLL